jgi:uncharacterized protein (TIGR02453 family)
VPNPYITPKTFQFFRELAEHNERGWFEANKQRYHDEVRDPLLRFVADFAPKLLKISKHMEADPRPVGGSLFRIYRDTRFAKDKSPYKTQAGMTFRHSAGRDVHGPVFYLNVEPGRVFQGAGLWHPPADALKLVRDAIVEKPERWKRSIAGLELGHGEDALKRLPRGYDPEHPCADDLRRRSFTSVTDFTQAQACAPDFLARYADACKRSARLMEFLTGALGLPW